MHQYMNAVELYVVCKHKNNVMHNCIGACCIDYTTPSYTGHTTVFHRAVILLDKKHQD
jgi:hypothetical protein